ncbi:nitrate- and nitrite sensing domain-containing protein [Streptomyces sp. DH24]|uniref:sensor histidine kinase n=1 Tax=Streptomyces sp. DH24 TaxID=3040123 RepID=UPI0024420E3A|nr:nitrate- and nitrite sensing domain-containing protein [Streptomyces sp. DH24]MDG9715429.1 nitrate- and nitrite sensing domain-containing protein [Streptomyces sp. DH24]
MPGTRDRRPRHRSAPRRTLRPSFVVPFLVPAVCLGGLWGYTAATLVDEQIQLHADADHISAARPVQEVLSRLQDERRLTALWQAGRSGSARKDLNAAREKTDAAISQFRRGTSALDTTALRSETRALDVALEALADHREAVDARTLPAGDAFAFFTDALSQGLTLLASAVHSEDAELDRGGDATIALAQITEMLAREDALLAGALPGGRLSATDRTRFSQYLAVQRAVRARLATRDLPGDAAEAYQRITGGSPWGTVTSVEQAVSGGDGNSLPQQASSWPTAADNVVGGFQSLGTDSLDALADEATGRSDELMLATLLGTAVTLAALAGGAVLALRARRSTTGRLSEIRTTTQQLAATRLPDILARTARGEQVEPVALTQHQQTADEYGQLSAAIDQLVQVAADSTLQQSRGREGTEKVVAQLIRRAQILIHRLISLLDDLERKHEDSDLLKDIFRVDHLATRVRRHTENLMILSGAAPNRRMTPPVPVTDLMRSAVSETEQYTRVRVRNTPADRRLALSGRAVADVTHLLAELIENGTSFSPPHTQVTVSAQRVGKGLALHVEDQGLGMQPEQRERANELLARPPKVDMTALGEDPRLGHFVVARLAERHGIKVALRESDYGGTLAVVIVPVELLEEVSSPVLDQLESSVTAGRPLEGRADAPPAVADEVSDGRHEALVGASADPVAGDVITHTRLSDSSGFPEYGGAGLLPPPSDHPVPPAQEPAEPPARRTMPSSSAYREPRPEQQVPSAGHASSPGGPSGLPRRDRGAARRRPAPSGQGSVPAGQGLTTSGQAPVRDTPRPPTTPLPASSPVPDAPRPLTTPSVLPQRVKGASLAQQLRKEAAQGIDRQEDDETISPVASARAMSAIHQGLKRAWTAQDDEPPGAFGRQDDSAGPSAHEL